MAIDEKKQAVRDHPHIRGEYLISKKLQEIKIGSPPHPWGIPGAVASEAKNHRITPTSVGNTTASDGVNCG